MRGLVASLVLSGVLASGCDTRLLCELPGQVRFNDRCIDWRDGSVVPDAGVDGGVDAGPCGICSGNTPVCRVDQARCVACVRDEDCPSALCDEPTNACVQCVGDAECTDPRRPVCNQGACEATCDDNADCTRFENQPACHPATGGCTQCNATEASRCTPSQTCDLTGFACSDVSPGERGTCEPCTNNLQCAAGSVCVRMTYNGESYGSGGFCLFVRSEQPMSVCPRPYRAMNRATMNSAREIEVCVVSEDVTTCDAVRRLQQGWECEVEGQLDRCRNLDSMNVAVPGAVCGTIGGQLACTIRCNDSSQCQPSGQRAPRCDTAVSVPFCTSN